MEEDLKVYSIEIICSEPVIILVIIVKKKGAHTKIKSVLQLKVHP